MPLKSIVQYLWDMSHMFPIRLVLQKSGLISRRWSLKKGTTVLIILCIYLWLSIETIIRKYDWIAYHLTGNVITVLQVRTFTRIHFITASFRIRVWNIRWNKFTNLLQLFRFYKIEWQWNLLSTYLKGDTKSVLIIRSTYYQGCFMYMRYTQGQNEEYLLSRSMY